MAHKPCYGYTLVVGETQKLTTRKNTRRDYPLGTVGPHREEEATMRILKYLWAAMIVLPLG